MPTQGPHGHGYVAVYPTDAFEEYERYLARRRAERPSEEYRRPTADEFEALGEHFGRRRVELGDCVRPYGTACIHEHARIRCNLLNVSPDAADRLHNIDSDLNVRTTPRSRTVGSATSSNFG